MIPSDLETLRKIMEDRRLWVSIGRITVVEYASDRSTLRVKVVLFPDNHEIIAKVGFSSVGPDYGNYGSIEVDKMALICIPEGLEDYAYVVCLLPSADDKIPVQAVDGDSISKSRAGKRNVLWGQTKAQIIGGDRINLAKTDMDVTEPLILGLVMQQAYEKALLRLSTLIDKMITGPMTVANIPGQPNPTHPQFILDLQAIKLTIDQDKDLYSTDDTTNFLSQLAFTERGGS